MINLFKKNKKENKEHYYKIAFCDENDFQKLSKNDNAGTVRDKILQTYNVKYAGACNYCSQGDLDIKFVRAGVQTDNRIFNSEYTIVKRKEYEELKGRS